jgi:hypothetical protein
MKQAELREKIGAIHRAEMLDPDRTDKVMELINQYVVEVAKDADEAVMKTYQKIGADKSFIESIGVYRSALFHKLNRL